MTTFFIDFETRSHLDLKKVSLQQYAQSTNIICMGWAKEDGEANIWLPGDDFPLMEGDTIVAHNAKFERAILDVHFPHLSFNFIDTQAIAQAHALPGKLAELGEYFNFPKESQSSLKRLMKPRRNGQYWTYEEKPEAYEELYKYCKRDVEICQKVYFNVPHLSDFEQLVYDATDAINTRGIPIDVPTVNYFIDLLEKESAQLVKECEDLCGIKPSQAKALAEYLSLPSVAADYIKAELAKCDLVGCDDKRRRILEIRQILAKSSVKKLQAMIQKIDDDGRVRNTLTYCGADKTRRWSGRTIQPQNFPRGDESNDTFNRLLQRPESFDSYFHAVSNNLRRVIYHPDGFFVGDYSQIEARVLAWITHSDILLDAFSSGKDVYKVQAAITFNTTYDKVTKEQRFFGKQQVLSLGYGCGYRKFRTMVAGYGVDISEEESQKLVDSYRNSNPKITQFWYHLERTIKESCLTGKSLYISKKPLIAIIQHSHGIAEIRLPHGSIWYPHLKYDVTEQSLMFYGKGYNYKRQMITTYGGKLTENVVSAIARHCLAHAVVELHKRNYKTVMLVHDEIVSVASKGSLEEFKEVMEQPLKWAEGLPVATDCTFLERYQK